MPSEKILEQKKQQVAQLAEDFKKANVGVLVNYEGITVEKDTKLRKQLREAGCEYKVVKNTLLSPGFPGGRHRGPGGASPRRHRHRLQRERLCGRPQDSVRLRQG